LIILDFSVQTLLRRKADISMNSVPRKQAVQRAGQMIFRNKRDSGNPVFKDEKMKYP